MVRNVDGLKVWLKFKQHENAAMGVKNAAFTAFAAFQVLGCCCRNSMWEWFSAFTAKAAIFYKSLKKGLVRLQLIEGGGLNGPFRKFPRVACARTTRA